jgi:hypothetical protein
MSAKNRTVAFEILDILIENWILKQYFFGIFIFIVIPNFTPVDKTRSVHFEYIHIKLNQINNFKKQAKY